MVIRICIVKVTGACCCMMDRRTDEQNEIDAMDRRTDEQNEIDAIIIDEMCQY